MVKKEKKVEVVGEGRVLGREEGREGERGRESRRGDERYNIQYIRSTYILALSVSRPSTTGHEAREGNLKLGQGGGGKKEFQPRAPGGGWEPVCRYLRHYCPPRYLPVVGRRTYLRGTCPPNCLGAQGEHRARARTDSDGRHPIDSSLLSVTRTNTRTV